MTLPDPLSADALREALAEREHYITQQNATIVRETFRREKAEAEMVALRAELGLVRMGLDAVCAAATALLDTNDIAEQWAAEKRLREAVAEARKS